MDAPPVGMMTLSSQAAPGAHAILSLLGQPDPDNSLLIDLLYGAGGLPPYAAAGSDVSERVMLALKELREAGEDTLAIRVDLGERLARLIDARPEQRNDLPALGDLLYALYRLAHKLSVPPKLHGALVRAIEREEGRRKAEGPRPSGPDHVGRPARAYLFEAAVVNQANSDLKCFWLLALRDLEVRRFWDVSWRDARGGIRFMPEIGADGLPRPSLSAIAKSLPLIAENIEADTKDPAERLERFSELIDLFCATWLNQIERSDVTALTVLEYCPKWCRQVLKDPSLHGANERTSAIQSIVGEPNYDDAAFWRDDDPRTLGQRIAELQPGCRTSCASVNALAYAAVRAANWPEGGDEPLNLLLEKVRNCKNRSGRECNPPAPERE